MKRHLYRAKVGWLATTAAISLLVPGVGLGVTFSITPAVVSNTYTGVITLNVGGLTNGEQVAIKKYLDINGNGTVDQGEPLVDAFKISDGGAFIIDGITDINVPFDSDPTAGAIATTVNFAPPTVLANVVGKYIFILSSPVQNFSPMTAILTVTNAAVNQSLSGVVYSDGTTPMPYALVAVLGAAGGGNWAAGAISDNTGHYHLTVPPGSYMLMPAYPGSFADQSLGPQVDLTNGMSATNDLFLTNGTVTVSGRVFNAASGDPVPGTMVQVNGGNSLFAVSFTDTNGDYVAGVGPGYWKVKVSSDQTISRGFVASQNGVNVDTTTGSVANVGMALVKATALFYGTFTNEAGQPLANVDMYASDNANQYDADGYTDAGGHFCVGVIGGIGDWYCSPDSSAPALAGYIVSQSNGTNVSVGQAVLLNFSALPATAQISGHVQDYHGNPVAGIGIIGSVSIGGVYYNSYMDTDANGNYTLSAASGVWNIFPNCCGSDGLDNFGLADVGSHLVTIPPTNAVMNLTLYPYGTPSLSPPMPNGPTTYGFVLSGAPGTNYTVQATTNLTSGNWFTVWSTTLTSQSEFFQDYQATNSQRFYRVLVGQ